MWYLHGTNTKPDKNKAAYIAENKRVFPACLVKYLQIDSLKKFFKTEMLQKRERSFQCSDVGLNLKSKQGQCRETIYTLSF